MQEKYIKVNIIFSNKVTMLEKDDNYINLLKGWIYNE